MGGAVDLVDRDEGPGEHAEKMKIRASLYETAVASELEANAVRTAPRGQRNSKFQEFAKTFHQRPNGPCIFHEFFARSAPSAENRVNWRETEEPGISSVSYGRLSHPT